ncbi:MAG: hypothetical protein KC506_02685 [Nanoarchaeota archaeon]|nr:hypothetical protein [Nanoarchaeota archaeon]
MQINFYEEFPSPENLAKLKLINFKTTLFLATYSTKEFLKIKNKVGKINKKITCAHWPLMKNSYWISPFANTKDLKGLFKELNKTKNKILIDLEPPRNKFLILKNLFSFHKNKKLIKNFLEENKQRITTAQFPPTIFSPLEKLLGLNYKVKTQKSFMWYSSMIPNFLNKNIRNKLKKIKNKTNISISLGTIAIGILGNEPILSPELLEKDLQFIKNFGYNEIIIFRAGGLNKNYLEKINKFTDDKKQK